MKPIKFISYVALATILLFSTSVNCPESVLNDYSLEIQIEPVSGTLATEFNFTISKKGADCYSSPYYWSVFDENYNQINLGEDAYKNQFSRKFEKAGKYDVSLNIGQTGRTCSGSKTFTVMDNGCYAYLEDNITWNITEIDLSPHRGYSYTNDTVSYGFILPTVQNVCAKEHILVQIGYYLRETRVNEVKITADVTYAILYEIPFGNFQLVDDDIFQQTESIGLSHIYGNDPGWFFIWFEIRFKNQGSDAANDEWLKNNFRWLTFFYDYWIYDSKDS